MTWLAVALGLLLAFAHVGLRAAARIESAQRDEPAPPPYEFSEGELLGGLLGMMLLVVLLLAITVGGQ